MKRIILGFLILWGFSGLSALEPLGSYITILSNEYKVPEGLILSIMEQENPEGNPVAVSPQNKNGTQDFGLFQLNSDSIPVFLRNYGYRKGARH